MRVPSMMWVGLACGLLGMNAGRAQDAATMAAQQSMEATQQAAQQAMQANQQAMQDAQRASEQAAEAAQTANDQAMREAQANAQDAATAPYPVKMPGAPQFSVKPGRYPGPITVRLKTKARSAAIYYTTDGWTPTTESMRYTGPIRITETTHLQAVAVGPTLLRTFVSSALYTLPAPLSQGLDAAIDALPAENEMRGPVSLSEGTEVPLVFATAVSTKTAQVGDPVQLTLAHDLRVAGVLVARKGTPASGTVLLADKPTYQGQPGVLQFAVNSLELPQGAVPLRGFEELDGADHEMKAGAWNAVLPLGAFVHGEDAEIPVGAKVTAYVAKEMTVDTAKLH